MNLLARIFIFSNIMAAVVSCSHLPQGVDRVALVDQLVKQHEFMEAKKLLTELDTQDPQYTALANRRRALRPLIERFEEKCVEQSRELRQDEYWVEALQVLDSGLKKVPNSKTLTVAREKLLGERQMYIDNIDRQMKLIEGKILPTQTALLQKRTEMQPENLLYRWELYRHQRKASAIVRDMIDCAEQAQQQGNFELSADCLNVAETMADSSRVPVLAKLKEKQVEAETIARNEEKAKRVAEEVAAAKKAQQIARAKRNLKEKARREKVKARRQIKHEEKRALKQLKQEYRDLIAAGWWLEARAKLEELKDKAPVDDTEVVSWSRRLQRLIDSRVKMGIEQGQVLYSQGFLVQALNVWRKAHELAPENAELSDHIARVERFLNNLDRLHAVEG